jgi:hypothetical protein
LLADFSDTEASLRAILGRSAERPSP